MTALQVRRLVIAGVAAVLLVIQEVIGYTTGAGVGQWTLTHTLIHTVAGLSYAVCGWLAWQSADSPVPGRIMVAIAFIWLPPPFIAAVWPLGWLWPLLEAVGLFWAVLLALLVAVYPTGKFQGRVERWVLTVGIAMGVVRIVVKLLCNQPPPEVCDCAPNVYAIFPDYALSELVDKAFRLVGVTLVLVIAIAVMVRWIRGTTPARHIAFIMPVALLIWCFTAAYVSVSFAFDTSMDVVLNYISLATTAAIPISFVAGLIYIRSLRGRVTDLMVLTRDGIDRDYWQGVLSETLRDPRLQVHWWDAEAGRYLDADGGAVAPDAPLPRGRALMAITSDGGRLALIDHDVALTENGKLLDAVSTALRLSVDNRRLRERLENTLQEVRESRVRIIEAGILTRRKLERDLHDGSQQSLVSLALNLRMAIGKARSAGQPELAGDLEGALEQLTEALRQLRELARGIHPSSLVVGGLGMAIGELAARSTVPVEVTVDVPGRMPPLTEATIYFFVAECLTNVAKYAGATRASVTVVPSEDGGLMVRVADDGRGGADPSAGTGLIGLVDRVEALEGVVEVVSLPGAGTTVTAQLPPTALE